MTSIFLKPEMHSELFLKSYDVLNRILKDLTDVDEKLAVKYSMFLLAEVINNISEKKLTKCVGVAMGQLPTAEMYAYAEKHGHLHEDDVSRMVH